MTTELPSVEWGKAHQQVTEKEFERRMVFARQKAVQAWMTEETSYLERNPALVEAFARILVIDTYQPHLGCATTRELLREIAARIDLEYSTILGDSSKRAVDCPHPVGKQDPSGNAGSNPASPKH